MREPKCDVCGKKPARAVKFADYAPLPDGMKGHPRGLGYLCGRHDRPSLSSLTRAEALERLRQDPRERPR